MNRKQFIKNSVMAASALGVGTKINALGTPMPRISSKSASKDGPLAITMWDFSWLERRWSGAGYEDWDLALDELKLRGYDAVRIDAYPHLVSKNATAKWDLFPVWTTQDWGSPAMNQVQVQPNLTRFMEKCAARDLKVALSTWMRVDKTLAYKDIKTPEDFGNIWVATLKQIEKAGLMDSILYVDLCNEFPLEAWTPFLPENLKRDQFLPTSNIEQIRWMNESLAVVRASFPELDYTFSNWENCGGIERDLSNLDVLDFHIWMAGGPFYKKVGYKYERFEDTGYNNLVEHGEKTYRADPEHWQNLLKSRIQCAAEESRAIGVPLSTTECWAVVDYKDWPLLNWDWVKELCAIGVKEAAATGRWTSMATSNFCGPQFVGMWRDVEWHQALTEIIHSSSIDKDLTK
jgi:hypothetical protein